MLSHSTLSIPTPQRAVVAAVVLLLHLALAWALLAGSRSATLPTLDITPIDVGLLPAAAPSVARQPFPITPPAASVTAHPTTPAPQAAPVPATVPAPAAPILIPTPTPATTLPSAAGAASSPHTASSDLVTNSTGANTSAHNAQAALVTGSCAKPAYPLASTRMDEEGTVTLRFRVEATGQVSQSEVRQSSGFKRLDETARSALSRCRFTPALVQGQASASWATIRYTWRLE